MKERVDMIAKMDAERAELNKFQQSLSNTMLGEGWIVATSSVLALRFSIVNRVVRDPKVCRVSLATRFTRKDAESVAEQVTNGRQEKAEAVHIKDMINRQIANLSECILALERAEDQEAAKKVGE